MDIIEESWEVQKKIEKRFNKLGKGKYGRILKMARKPDADEYQKTLTICIVGILLIGGLGFLIFWLWDNLPNYLFSLM
ncbi:MAG: protein translocase SEC61 complex subunit gamma [Thermoplasmatota archaeon]